MTAIIEAPQATDTLELPLPTQPVSRWKRVLAWLMLRWQSAVLLTVLLVPVGVLTGYNMTGYPARFEDEGTYTAQAWAMLKLGQIANYTYWYDHPFFGWAQLAGWLGLTDALDRYDSAITAGREFSWVCNLVSCALLFLLARRLGMRRLFAALAVALFALSPLAMAFHRYMLLDNIATPWVLAAFALALSPRRHVSVTVGSALCMVGAILSKETTIVLVPALLYLLWQHSDMRNRRYHMAAMVTLLPIVSAGYLLYSVVKNELLEGSGHVSLVGAMMWQLFDRQGSGSVFNPNSGAHGLVGLWLGLDTWLLAAGLLAMVPAVFIRQLRPIGLALLVQALLVLRTGYLPYPYIIGLLPFAALLIAGVANGLWGKSRLQWRDRWSIQLRRILTVAALATLLAMVIPSWYGKTGQYLTNDADSASRNTVTWIEQHVPHNSRLVVDSALWLDLVRDGYNDPRAVWLYKVDSDPEVAHQIGGWHGIQYIAVSAATLDPRNAATFPTVFQAKEHSQAVAEFGSGSDKILILQVQDDMG